MTRFRYPAERTRKRPARFCYACRTIEEIQQRWFEDLWEDGHHTFQIDISRHKGILYKRDSSSRTDWNRATRVSHQRCTTRSIHPIPLSILHLFHVKYDQLPLHPCFLTSTSDPLSNLHPQAGDGIKTNRISTLFSLSFFPSTTP